MGYAAQFANPRSNWLSSWDQMTDLIGFNGNGFTNSGWPGGMPNDAFISRVWNPEEFEAAFAYSLNGTTPANNIDIGVYTAAGDLIVSTGATAQAGAAQAQYIALPAGTIMPRGVLLLAMAADNANVQYQTPNVSASSYHLNQLDAYGWAQAQTSYPLPSALPTLVATPASILPPFFGIVGRLL